MEGNVPGSQDEPFYELLYPQAKKTSNADAHAKPSPSSSSSSPPPPSLASELGLEPDLVIPTIYDSRSPPKAMIIRDYAESSESGKEKEKCGLDEATIAVIERSVKQQCDRLQHMLEGICGRLAGLEHKAKNLEHLVAELKMAVGNNHEETTGRISTLENILREVQTGVQILRDKEEIAEARAQLERSQITKAGPAEANPAQNSSDSIPTEATGQPQSPWALPFNSQPQASFPAPVQDPKLPAQVQMPGPIQTNVFPSQQQSQPVPMQTPTAPPPAHQQPLTSISSLPSEPSYNTALPSSVPPAPPPSVAKPLPYEVPPHMPQMVPHSNMLSYSDHSQASQPAGQPASYPYGHSEVPVAGAAHPVQPSQMPTSVPGNYGSEPNYMPSGYTSSASRQPQPVSPQHIRLSSSPNVGQGGQQLFEKSFGRTFSGSSAHQGYAPGAGLPYGDPQSYSGPMYSPQQSELPMPSSGSGHPRLPTAKPVPRSLPVATAINSPASNTNSSTNRVPIDDVIDKVTTMGFPRDQVKLVVRKLTENGQSVDLNVVLDKLMNNR